MILCGCIPSVLFAQTFQSTEFTGTYSNTTVFEFLEVLEERYDVKFYYNPVKLPWYKVDIDSENESLYLIFERILDGSNLELINYGEKILLIESTRKNKEYAEEIIAKWENGSFQKPVNTEPLVMELNFGNPKDQSRQVVFSGKITSEENNEPLIGAILQNVDEGTGEVTDESGNFQYQLVSGTHQVLIQSLGFRPIQLTLHIHESAEQDFKLESVILSLDEVVVKARADRNKVEDVQSGIEALTIQEVKELPAFLGEADVIKSLQTLSGVSTASEASAGFNVRGGSIDQNLVILDEAILFNPSHALGFFSAFNTDALRNVTLYKGNVPAQHGGRLSSVLEVGMKTGDFNKWSGSGGLGTASARLTLNGPVIPEKLSLVGGFKTSYSGWLLNLISAPNIRNSRVYFGDGVAKLTAALSDKHQISATGYFSSDLFQYATEFGYKWNSSFGSLRWNYFINDNTSLTTTVVIGDYGSQQYEPDGSGAFRLDNGITYEKVKTAFSKQGNSHFIQVGAEAIQYHMDPEQLRPYDDNSAIIDQTFEKDQAFEISAFINDEWKISERLSASIGLRYTYYQAIGPATVNTYQPGVPKGDDSFIEQLTFSDGEKIIDYSGLEPRISINYKLSSFLAIKGSYNRNYQYLHLISNTSNSTPVDQWQLSNYHIAPKRGDKFSVGLINNINDMFTLSVDAFYLGSENQVDYKEFATLVLNPSLETDLLSGDGRAYGAEFVIDKRKGKWSGQLSYTYSRSELQIQGNSVEETINRGEWYPSYFDQPHQITLTLKHQNNPVRSTHFSFTYKTGRPISVPVGGYEVDNILISHFVSRNSFRIPAYHRLDFGFFHDQHKSKVKGFRNSFYISVYNLYGRKNPFTVYFRRNESNALQTYQLSILGSVFPTITWNFSF